MCSFNKLKCVMPYCLVALYLSLVRGNIDMPDIDFDNSQNNGVVQYYNPYLVSLLQEYLQRCFCATDVMDNTLRQILLCQIPS